MPKDNMAQKVEKERNEEERPSYERERVFARDRELGWENVHSLCSYWQKEDYGKVGMHLMIRCNS